MKQVTLWLIAHTLALLAMYMNAAFSGIYYWLYLVSLLIVGLFLLVKAPIIGLLEKQYYERFLVLKHIEAILLNAVWITLATYTLLLAFKNEHRMPLVTAFLIVILSMGLSLYRLALKSGGARR